MRPIILILSYLLCLHHTATATEAVCSHARQLADNYLSAFGAETEKSICAIQQHKTGKSKKRGKIHMATEIHLTPRDERAIVFNAIFAKSNRYQEQYQQRHKVFNPYAWNDLHLFCGTTTTPNYHFLSCIDKTITVLGEGAFAALISAPIADLTLLTQRQQVVAIFYKDNQITNDLKQELKNYKTIEKAMLSLWSATDPLYTKEYNEYLMRLFYTKNPASNKKAAHLQWKKIVLRDMWDIYASYIRFPLIGAIIGPVTVALNKNSGVTVHGFFEKVWPEFIPIYGIFHVKNRKLQNPELKIKGYALSTMFTLLSLYDYYRGYQSYKEYAGILKNLALRMADLQTFLTTIQKVNRLVQQHAHLEGLYGKQLTAIRTLLACSGEPSEVGTLLHYLKILPLRSWSYLRHNAGKLLASYKLFEAHKTIFNDAMYELGQLDAFLSVATLMQQTAAMGAPHAYTFTNFLFDQDQPQLVIQAMWNPMLKPRAAIGNDSSMGGQTNTQSIILTGPNAGGKSTFLTGITYAIVLSQTFGIAPAQSCAMTPFHKINTYIDVTGDIAAGKSLFMSEAFRLQEHLKMLAYLDKTKFSFSIFDEPFSGTDPAGGAAVEYSALSSIAAHKNALNIVATHYPEIMLLEKNEPMQGFKNYKVFIKHRGRGNKIEYTYKVIPGESTQTIAIDILEEQGFDPTILKQARDIIKNPEKYKKSFSTKK